MDILLRSSGVSVLCYFPLSGANALHCQLSNACCTLKKKKQLKALKFFAIWAFFPTLCRFLVSSADILRCQTQYAQAFLFRAMFFQACVVFQQAVQTSHC